MSSALAAFFAFLWRVLDVLRRVLHLALLLFIFGFLLALLHHSIPKIPRSAALILSPEGQLVEELSLDGVRRALGEASGGTVSETRLADVIEAIEAAKTDARIKLIVLDVDQLDRSGLSKLQDVGAALRDFRTSGKRVVAIGNSYDQAQYYLAAQAGEVYLDPFGMVMVEGFGYYRQFFKEAIDKLAIDVNVFKVGTYKSFTEGFTRSQMSDTEKEEAQVWLNTLWNAYEQDVERARSLPQHALSDYIASAPAALSAVNGDAAKLALQRGLVTALKSRRQIGEELKSIVGEDASTHFFNQVAMKQYLTAVRAKNALKSKSGGRVGVIVASGDIMEGRQGPGSIGGDSTSDLLRQAQYDNDIKAVVLRVDSPGGSMFASEEISREVQRLRKAGKPVIVSMSTYAASGAYYFAAAANQIFASPTTLTGSIGVFAVLPTFQRSIAKLGVNVDGIGTTPLSGTLRLDRALGDNARKILQTSVENAYSRFLLRVSEGRKKSVEDVDRIAQGRVWAGIDAQRLGLIDHLGGLREAADAAAKMADLAGDYDLQYIQPDLSFREQLVAQLRGGIARAVAGSGALPHASLVKDVAPLLDEIDTVARIKDQRGLFSYCWCKEN